MTIKTSNLGKRFNREWIFKGLTTEFAAGNIYAITGPNGSGKSTLMQVLWGQIPSSEGDIKYSLNGLEIPIEDIFRHISLAAPYMELLEEFTLLEQVRFHFRFKLPINKLKSEEIIERMQMEASIHKPIKQFSSGMKQRLKLSLAIFSDAPILFLDEPTTNLDARAADWYMANLMTIKAEKLVFIASNQHTDFPEMATVINLSDLKAVTNGKQLSIQANI